MTLYLTEEWLIRQTPEFQVVIRHLLAEIAQVKEQVRKLTPQNSSLPPSSLHPHAKPPRTKPKGRRRRGGQRGHGKHELALVPLEKCHDLIDLHPTVCRRCDTRLRGDDSEPLRHQVWELPVIQPLITEYRRHRLTCPCCGETTYAPLPTGVPVGLSGPRMVAFTGC
jgi:transposase